MYACSQWPFAGNLGRRLRHLLTLMLLLLAGCTHPAVEPNPPAPPDDEPIYSEMTSSLQASLGRGGAINLSWEADPKLKTYRILRAQASSEQADPKMLRFEQIGETTDRKFTDEQVILKTVYFYKIQAQYSPTRVIESNVVSEVIKSLYGYDLAYKTYTDLATLTGGKRYDVATAASLPQTIIRVIKEHAGGQDADIMFLIDNTGSMHTNIRAVKQELNKIIDALPASARLGVGGYRDRGDEYLLRFQDLTSDFSVIRAFINNMFASGGGDIPEPIYDVLYSTVTQASWQKKKRIVILIGDSPPHEGDKTTHSQAEVVAKCRQAGVAVNLYPILVDLNAEEGSEGG